MQFKAGKTSRSGFSLVELSIVLVIVGVLVASSLSLGSAQLEVMDVKSTQTKLDRIEAALQYYYNVNRSVPCPAAGTTAIGASGFGLGGKTTPLTNSTKSDAACPNATAFQSNSLYIGVVPVRDLNLSDEYMFDSWGNRIDYAVSKNCVDPDNWSESNLYRCAPQASTTLPGAGLSVLDLNGNERTDAGLYVLISHGQNGVGAWRRAGGSRIPSTASTSTMEMNNAHINTSGVTTTYDADFVDGFINNGNVAAKYFDDIVRWKTPVMFYEEMITVVPEGDSGCGITTHNTSNHYYPCATNENPVTLTGIHNNVFGDSAGFKLTIGESNNFMGYSAGKATTEGYYNNFFGHEAGLKNTTGSSNTFFGKQAGYENTTGTTNNFFGETAGYQSQTGNGNNFMGYRAGYRNTSGSQNNYFGASAGGGLGATGNTGSYNNFLTYEAGYSNTTGSHNNFFGMSSGYTNTTGEKNVFIGSKAGYNNTTASNNIGIGTENAYSATTVALTGADNIFLGRATGAKTTSGSKNIFAGMLSGTVNTTGTNNIFLGSESGTANTSGNNNVMIGNSAGKVNTTADNNVFIGTASGFANTTGHSNTFLGTNSGQRNTTGVWNVAIGYLAGSALTTGNGNLAMGNLSAGNNEGVLTTGSWNMFFGYATGWNQTTGAYNIFLGYQAGNNNTTGSDNIAIGRNSGSALAGYPWTAYPLTGGQNLFLGANAGANTSSGSSNSFVGYQSGSTNTTGANNSTLGALASVGTGFSYATAIGAGASVNQSNSVVIGRTTDNVGIGTIAPQANLHVSGTLRLDLTTASTATTTTGGPTLPARAAGYLTINIDGTNYKIPYYAN